MASPEDLDRLMQAFAKADGRVWQECSPCQQKKYQRRAVEHALGHEILAPRDASSARDEGGDLPSAPEPTAAEAVQKVLAPKDPGSCPVWYGRWACTLGAGHPAWEPHSNLLLTLPWKGDRFWSKDTPDCGLPCPGHTSSGPRSSCVLPEGHGEIHDSGRGQVWRRDKEEVRLASLEGMQAKLSLAMEREKHARSEAGEAAHLYQKTLLSLDQAYALLISHRRSCKQLALPDDVLSSMAKTAQERAQAWAGSSRPRAFEQAATWLASRSRPRPSKIARKRGAS